jgi:hypothetical protein
MRLFHKWRRRAFHWAVLRMAISAMQAAVSAPFAE